MLTVVKQIYGEYLRAKEKGNTLPDLETRLNPKYTIDKIKRRFNWMTAFQDALISLVILFSFSIMPFSLPIKALILLVLITLILVPITGQFFGYALPVLGWVFLFFSSRYVPLSMRRPITVTVLPAVETIFYGENLSEVLASYTSTFLDVLFWLPYGLLHFSLPFVVAALIFLLAPPTTLRRFAWSFGFMNLVGVIIQNFLFACAPPWYKVLHGLEKANYSMKGSPGGLARIDKLFGTDMYTSGFTNAPLIFGAMPSLHSGCSTMDCLWLCYLFPRLTPVWCVYVLWLWASTMYLTHHYFIDLVCGSALAITFFGVLRIRGNLPINSKLCRWSYDSIECFDMASEDPLGDRGLDRTGFDDNVDDDLASVDEAFAIDDDDDAASVDDVNASFRMDDLTEQEFSAGRDHQTAPEPAAGSSPVSRRGSYAKLPRTV